MKNRNFKSAPPLTEKRSDIELISLIINQENFQLFGILYSRHVKKVFDQCYYYINDEQKAEDFTHDIFLKVYDKLDSFAGNSSFGTWLSSITRNFCLDYKRKNKNKRIIWVEDFKDNTQFALIEYPVEFEPDEGLISKKRLYRILSEINADERDLIEMKYFEGRSIIEIKDQLNLSTQSATKMRLKRTRDKIRKRYYAKS